MSETKLITHVGQTLWVMDEMRRRRGARGEPAVVTKIGRVWATAATVDKNGNPRTRSFDVDLTTLAMKDGSGTTVHLSEQAYLDEREAADLLREIRCIYSAKNIPLANVRKALALLKGELND